MQTPESLLYRARAERDLGDIEQAWDALARYLQDVAQARGWKFDRHNDVFRTTSALSKVTDDPDAQYHRLLAVRVAVFEPHVETEESVLEMIVGVGRLIAALRETEPHFPSEPPPQPSGPRTIPH